MRTTILAAACLALLAGCSRGTDTTESTAAAPAATTAATPADAAAPVKEQVFAREELDQMVAPVALYPDPLLAQVLMAATYPGDVADAAAWSKAHPDAQGDAAVKQVAAEPWDPSVQSLVAFPQALAVLGQDPAWVQRLGDAFLAQPDDVMDAVQRLRQQAQAAGNLESNDYQQVSTQAAPASASTADGSPAGPAPVASDGGDQVIVIQPSDPQVVYVPSYNPTTVYGSWAYPSYPPTYYPPPSAYYPVGGALVSGMMFGVGMAITDSLWGDFDWGHDDIDIDINRYNNINVNRQLDVDRNRWEHNPANRDGVPYRDQAHRAANGRQLDGARDREAFRGDDPQRAQAREQARAKMGQHGIDAPARTNQEARDRAQAAARDHAGQGPGARTGGQDAARERAAATAQQHQARDRAANAAKDRPNAGQHAQNRPDATRPAQQRPAGSQRAQPQQHRQAQSNEQARAAAARQHAQQGQHGGNNAFSGAREPSRSHAQAQRGNASQAAAHRPQNARPAGKPVHRTASAPQRQGGGRHR